MKRTLLLVALALSATYAAASFELALVLDGSSKKVHRYDAVTGAYLGSFGSFNSPASITINKPKNEVIVWDKSFGGIASNGAALHFNYNTGELNYAATNISAGVSWISARQSGSGYYMLNPGGTGYFDYNADLSSGGLVSFSGTTGMARGDILNASQIVYQNNTNRVSLISTATQTSLANVAAAIASVDDVAVTPITAFGLTIGAVSSSAGALQAIGFSASGISYGASMTASVTGFSSIAGISASHLGIVAVGMSAGGSPMMKNFAYGRGVSYGGSAYGGTTSFSISQCPNPIDIATVVAPEPASIIGAGMGMALLLIRRKKV